MKIEFNKRPKFEKGHHKVTISNVYQGKSKHKGTPYLSVEFRNENKVLERKIYLTEKGKYIVKKLMEFANLIYDDLVPDWHLLSGKHLSIWVERGQTVDLENCGIIYEFDYVREFNKANFDWSEFGKRENEADNFDESGISEFVNLDAVASDFGISSSQVTDDHIYLYLGN